MCVCTYTTCLFLFSDSKGHNINIQDLLRYSKKLHELRALGIVLEIKDYAEGVIRGNESCQDKCILILEKWLEVTTRPTWEEFCEKLRQPGLEMMNLANEITEKHIMI